MSLFLPVVVLTLCASVISAQNPITKNESPVEKWLRMDVNRDNELTLDEFLHMDVVYERAKKEEFDNIDVNNNNQIEKKEYEDHFHLHERQVVNPRSQYFGKIFEDFDDNIDLALDEEEVRRLLAERFLIRPRLDFPQVFASFDRDHSGGLDLFEYMRFDEDFSFAQGEPINGLPATEAAIVAAALAKSGSIQEAQQPQSVFAPVIAPGNIPPMTLQPPRPGSPPIMLPANAPNPIFELGRPMVIVKRDAELHHSITRDHPFWAMRTWRRASK